MYNSAQDLVNAGYKKYIGWGNAEALADFKATGGGANSNSSGGGSSYNPPSVADIANIRSQVYNTLKPYYVQLAKEAQGDLNRAVQFLKDDYVTGVRNDKINFAFTKSQQEQELTNTLSQLGITNFSDQRDLIDKLNQRGMAAYQNNPDGTYNALNTSNINSNTSFDVQPGNPYNNTSTIANPANSMMGEGGFELAQLQMKQRLQQEAQQRAATKPIEQAGIQLKQQTSGLPAGVDLNADPATFAQQLQASGVNPSSLGTREQALIQGQANQVRDAQKAQENLTNQLGADVSGITSQVASTQDKSQSQQLANQLAQEKTTQFINTGTGA